MMGLDIRAYSQIKLIDTLATSDEWEEKYYYGSAPPEPVYIYSHYLQNDADFHEWAEGLIAGGVYQFNKTLHVRAGAYSAYNRWRNWLSITALGVPASVVWSNEDRYVDKPFYRLINFSDCEGYIGPLFAKSLAKDFADHRDVVNHTTDEWNKKKYGEWLKAFELAAENGFIDFH